MKLLEKATVKIVNGLIVLFLSAMVLLAFLQIVLRNVFSSGISWADVTVRHMVLWVGFFGAVLATIQERHIILDVFSRLLPQWAIKYIRTLIYLGSLVVCGLLAYASYKFVASERLMGELLFGGVPVWWAQLVIPLTFGIMGVLFLMRALDK